ncbi:MAG TPA: hypothetical protein VIR78_14505 [Malonomonas sp.]
MVAPLVLIVATGTGGLLGWYAGSPMGLMGAYLLGVLGASVGLFIGRRLQRNLDGD